MKILVMSGGVNCELSSSDYSLNVTLVGQEETSSATIQQNPLTCIQAAEEECGITKVKQMWCSGQTVTNKQQFLQTLLSLPYIHHSWYGTQKVGQDNLLLYIIHVLILTGDVLQKYLFSLQRSSVRPLSTFISILWLLESFILHQWEN